MMAVLSLLPTGLSWRRKNLWRIPLMMHGRPMSRNWKRLFSRCSINRLPEQTFSGLGGEQELP